MKQLSREEYLKAKREGKNVKSTKHGYWLFERGRESCAAIGNVVPTAISVSRNGRMMLLKWLLPSEKTLADHVRSV